MLHCTVANAAGVVERLGSMTMQELMRELMRIADEAVRRYEGMISQRHADGFVAVFGTPVVHEDDGQRSILAALAIQDRFRALASRHRREEDDRLDLQIGIHTGPLVVTRVADAHHVEYTAVGETMRMADLLQQFAEPGAVLLSETTRRVVGDVSVDPVIVPAAAGGRAYRTTGLVREPKAAPRLARRLRQPKTHP